MMIELVLSPRQNSVKRLSKKKKILIFHLPLPQDFGVLQKVISVLESRHFLQKNHADEHTHFHGKTSSISEEPDSLNYTPFHM